MRQVDTATPAKQWGGVALILATGLLHLVEAPEYYGEVKYIGALFVACMAGALVSAYGIWQDRAWGWWLGLAVAGGSVLAYFMSRTVGLPSFRENSLAEALEPMGVISVVVELAFVFVALTRMSASGDGYLPNRRSYE